jgi:DNA-nicking Smr family endonuclease
MARKIRSGKPSDRPTTAEEELFRATMADAIPIKHNKPAEDLKPPIQMEAKLRHTSHDVKPTGASSPKTFLEAGKAADIDRRTMVRLRKGQRRPEARLDLHGMTADQASGALRIFLKEAQGAGKRCILVITGKGSMKEGGGVLRREFPTWLNAPGNRGRVLGFSGAQPADGGSGAFYVLLKRLRPGSGH